MIAGLVMAAAIVIAVVLCLGLLALFGGSAGPRARAEHDPMPEPRLEPHPLRDRARYDARQRAKLTDYAWVDRSAGIVRIPIGQAMQILAAHGKPAAAPEKQPAAP
jgi:hypothetical protein